MNTENKPTNTITFTDTDTGHSVFLEPEMFWDEEELMEEVNRCFDLVGVYPTDIKITSNTLHPNLAFTIQEGKILPFLWEYYRLSSGEQEVVDAYLEGVTVVSKDVNEVLKDHCETYESYKEFAINNCRALEKVPSFIESHINLESLGRELAQDYLAVEHNNQLFVFNY